MPVALKSSSVKGERQLTLRDNAPRPTPGEEFLPPPVVGEVAPKVDTFADLPIYDCPIPPLDPYDAPFPPHSAVLTRGGLSIGSEPPPAEALDYIVRGTTKSIEDWTDAVNTSIGGNWVVKNVSVSWGSGGGHYVDIQAQSAANSMMYYPVTTGTSSVTYPGTGYATLGSPGWTCSSSATTTRYLRYNATAASGGTATWTLAGDSPYEVECDWSWYDSSTTQINRGTTRHTIRDRRQALAEIIKNRAFPGIHIKPNRQYVAPSTDVREVRARETLKRVIGEQAYRNFLVNGFVSVKSRRTQRIYVVYPGHGQTKVFQDGKFIERLCVVLPGNFPPTDSLITRYLMILNDEAHFRSLANKSTYADTKFSQKKAEPKSLVEIALDLPARYQQKRVAVPSIAMSA